MKLPNAKTKEQTAEESRKLAGLISELIEHGRAGFSITVGPRSVHVSLTGINGDNTDASCTARPGESLETAIRLVDSVVGPHREIAAERRAKVQARYDMCNTDVNECNALIEELTQRRDKGIDQMKKCVEDGAEQRYSNTGGFLTGGCVGIHIAAAGDVQRDDVVDAIAHAVVNECVKKVITAIVDTATKLAIAEVMKPGGALYRR